MEATLSLPLVFLQTFRLLLLVCTLSISCLASSSGACEMFRCGKHALEYPFGAKNSGCGDPTLQLECDYEEYLPLINISGKQYYIVLPVLFLGGIKTGMKIVDKNLWKHKCNVRSDVYAQFWTNNQFRIETGIYTNISLGIRCTEGPAHSEEEITCMNHKYYDLRSHPNMSCESKVNLPVKDPGRPISEILHGGADLLISWNVSRYCNDCNLSKKNCNYRKTPTFCYCNGTSYSERCARDRSKLAIIILGSSAGGSLALAAALALFLIKRRKPAVLRGLAIDIIEFQGNDIEGGRKIGNLPIFSYRELEHATNFFDPKNELGEGGFGSVYKGKLKDGRTIAVKRLFQDNSKRVEQFINEVQIVSSVHHPNLVGLYGCTCPRSPVLLFVYEFMPKGTLADHLYGHKRGPKGLAWETRLNIAIDTAQALAFLHSVDPPIYHRDVKSTNILLDENFRAKVGDFGLSRLVPIDVSHVTTAPQGTPGYLDPEYHRCFQLTEKSDVYSFGVVLVEIISAKIAVDLSRKRNEIVLAKMAVEKIRNESLHELVDPLLEIETKNDVKAMVSAVAELALGCLARERDVRPDMREVAARLEDIKQKL